MDERFSDTPATNDGMDDTKIPHSSSGSDATRIESQPEAKTTIESTEPDAGPSTETISRRDREWTEFHSLINNLDPMNIPSTQLGTIIHLANSDSVIKQQLAQLTNSLRFGAQLEAEFKKKSDLAQYLVNWALITYTLGFEENFEKVSWKLAPFLRLYEGELYVEILEKELRNEKILDEDSLKPGFLDLLWVIYRILLFRIGSVLFLYLNFLFGGALLDLSDYNEDKREEKKLAKERLMEEDTSPGPNDKRLSSMVAFKIQPGLIENLTHKRSILVNSICGFATFLLLKLHVHLVVDKPYICKNRSLGRENQMKCDRERQLPAIWCSFPRAGMRFPWDWERDQESVGSDRSVRWLVERMGFNQPLCKIKHRREDPAWKKQSPILRAFYPQHQPCAWFNPLVKYLREPRGPFIFYGTLGGTIRMPAGKGIDMSTYIQTEQLLRRMFHYDVDFNSLLYGPMPDFYRTRFDFRERWIISDPGRTKWRALERRIKAVRSMLQESDNYAQTFHDLTTLESGRELLFPAHTLVSCPGHDGLFCPSVYCCIESNPQLYERFPRPPLASPILTDELTPPASMLSLDDSWNSSDETDVDH